MSTIALKNNAVVNNTKSSHISLGERIKKYFIENASMVVAAEQVSFGTSPVALKSAMACSK